MQQERPNYELRLTFTAQMTNALRATIWVRLRQGGMHPAYAVDWPAGAPTQQQLEELSERLEYELQQLVLGSCGVQGALTLTDGR